MSKDLTEKNILKELAVEEGAKIADLMVTYLNEILRLDPEAVHSLLETRVPCNTALADHPTVQVHAQNGTHTVGLLGVLNGFVGTDLDGWGFVCACYDNEGKLLEFKRTPARS
jgi:hypothetical protein